jgi:hypothetical protein
MTSSGGEVKPSHVVRFYGKIHGHFSPSFSLLCNYMSLLMFARELWWVNLE